MVQSPIETFYTNVNEDLDSLSGTVAEVKQRSQESVTAWVPKIVLSQALYLFIILSLKRYVHPLVPAALVVMPTNPH
jgi:hypothetical protein